MKYLTYLGNQEREREQNHVVFQQIDNQLSGRRRGLNQSQLYGPRKLRGPLVPDRGLLGID